MYLCILNDHVRYLTYIIWLSHERVETDVQGRFANMEIMKASWEKKSIHPLLARATLPCFKSIRDLFLTTCILMRRGSLQPWVNSICIHYARKPQPCQATNHNKVNRPKRPRMVTSIYDATPRKSKSLNIAKCIYVHKTQQIVHFWCFLPDVPK